jgi:23S rRNA (cytidine1920-2'-O)/16S rRNA (cytidine1409-2'-O)-methyltransferase
VSPAAGTTRQRSRKRLDQLLVERDLAPTRARAQALIMAGLVRVGVGDAARVDRKAGDLVDAAVPVDVAPAPEYVSRGGLKLAAALDALRVDPAGRVCLDVGASTGGFTDVLLQRGARRVYALDVGRGQLATSLRADPRVVSMERTNARTLGPTTLAERVELATVDVSFISLRLVLRPIASAFSKAGGPIVALVKPQFEAGRSEVKGGVVRDPAVHRAVLEDVAGAARNLGIWPTDVVASPITGPEGNREFFLRFDVGVAGTGTEATDEAALAARIADVALGSPTRPAGSAA